MATIDETRDAVYHLRDRIQDICADFSKKYDIMLQVVVQPRVMDLATMGSRTSKTFQGRYYVKVDAVITTDVGN